MRQSAALAFVIAVLASPLLASPAHAGDIVNKQKLESRITKEFKDSRDIKIRTICPKQTNWVKGKVFYCKVTGLGVQSKVRITLVSKSAKKGHLRMEFPVTSA